MHGTHLELLGFNVKQQQFASSLNRGRHWTDKCWLNWTAADWHDPANNKWTNMCTLSQFLCPIQLPSKPSDTGKFILHFSAKLMLQSFFCSINIRWLHLHYAHKRALTFTESICHFCMTVHINLNRILQHKVPQICSSGKVRGTIYRTMGMIGNIVSQ
jgi:hypothetical protein